MDTCVIRIATYLNIGLFVRSQNATLMVTVLFQNRDQGFYKLHGFAVMPEHLHVLLTPSRDQTLEHCAECIKGGFSDEMRWNRFSDEMLWGDLSNVVRLPYFRWVWQPGFREDWIRDAEDFRKQLAHIAANPERRGLVHWEFVHTRFSERLDPMPERLGR
jgi:putative transposase